MKKISVLIARAQGPHEGHGVIFEEALDQTDELVVALGSANLAPEPYRNPWPLQDRANMIRLMIDDLGLEQDRISIIGVEDHPYNQHRWLESVNSLVYSQIYKKFSPDPYEISLIGHKKDHSSFYLDLFPQWKSIGVKNYKGYNSTDIRTALFNEKKILTGLLTDSVADYMNEYMKGESFDRLHREYHTVKQIRARWAGAPYEPTFNTTDAVITQAGHILMVTRAAAPGEGLLALPGGYLNPKQTFLESMLREVRQETKIDVPDKVLAGSIKWHRSFDDPYRSSRGRIVTEAYHIDLGSSGKLPKVKGHVYAMQDENGELNDTKKAEWIELSKLDGNRIFEDHLAIIRTMVGI